MAESFWKRNAKGKGSAGAKGDSVLKNKKIGTPSNPWKDSHTKKITWDCVWFGHYPQVEIVSSSLMDKYIDDGVAQEKDPGYIVSDEVYSQVQNAIEWDENGDIVIGTARIRRVSKADVTRENSSRSGSFNWDGAQQYHYYVYQPLKWRVFRTDGNTATMISDKVIDCRKFHSENGEVKWADSELRAWLNDSFIKTAFGPKEGLALQISTVSADDNDEFDIMAGDETSDRIYLLSYKDVCGATAPYNGFDSDKDALDSGRKAGATSYAKCMGVNSVRDICEWWLRTPGDDDDIVSYVTEDGNVDLHGSYAKDDKYGVRVAAKIDLSDASIWAYAGSVTAEGDVEEQDIPDSLIKAAGSGAVAELEAISDSVIETTDSILDSVAEDTEEESASEAVAESTTSETKESVAASVEEKVEEAAEAVEEATEAVEEAAETVEEAAETVEETAEADTVEAVAEEVVETAVEPAAEEIEDTAEEVAEAVAEAVEEPVAAPKKLAIDQFGSFGMEQDDTPSEAAAEAPRKKLSISSYEDFMSAAVEDTAIVEANAEANAESNSESTVADEAINEVADEIVAEVTAEAETPAAEPVAEEIVEEPATEEIVEESTVASEEEAVAEVVADAEPVEVADTEVADTEDVIEETDEVEEIEVVEEITEEEEAAAEAVEETEFEELDEEAEDDDASYEYEDEETDSAEADSAEEEIEAAEDEVVTEDVIEASSDEAVIVEDEVEIVEDEVEVVADEVEEAANEVEIVEDEVEIVEDEVEIVEDEVEIVEDEVEIVEDEVEVVEDEVEIVEDEVEIVEDEVEIVEDEVEIVEDEVEIVEDEIEIPADAAEEVEIVEDTVEVAEVNPEFDFGAAYVPTEIAQKYSQSLSASISPSVIRYGKKARFLAGGVGDISFTSSDTSIASIDAKGEIIAKRVGTALLTMHASGDDDYDEAAISLRVTVVPADLQNGRIAVSNMGNVYNGNALTPKVIVMYEDAELVKGADYSVEYSDNVNAGSALVTITGVGNYAGVLKKNFEIAKADQKVDAHIDASEIMVGKIGHISAIGHGPVAFASQDVRIAEVSANGEITANGVGLAEFVVTVAGNENYNSASCAVSVKIAPISCELTDIELLENNYVYTGKAIEPEFVVRYEDRELIEGADYTVSYDNNVNAGTARLTIKGMGNFAGEKSIGYSIVRANGMAVARIKDKSIVVDMTGQIRTKGYGDISYVSTNSNIATVSETGLVTAENVGTVDIRVISSGDSNHLSAETVVTIEVEPIDASDAQIIFSGSNPVYNGSEVEPAIMVQYDGETLVRDRDYTVTCSDNVDAGRATAIVTGIGNYSGKSSRSFVIEKAHQQINAWLDNYDINVGEKSAFHIEAFGDISCSTSAKRILAVNGLGEITAKSAGTATITIIASGDENHYEASSVFDVRVH